MGFFFPALSHCVFPSSISVKLSFSIYVSAKCLEVKGRSSAAQGWIKTTVPFSLPSPDPEKGRGSRTAHILPRVGTVLRMLQADSCPYSSWDGACRLPHTVHPTSLPMEGSPSPAPTCPNFMSAAKCAYHCQEAVGIFLMLPRAVPRSHRDCSSSGTQHKSLLTTSIGKMVTLSLFCPSCCAPVSLPFSLHSVPAANYVHPAHGKDIVEAPSTLQWVQAKQAGMALEM